MCAELLGRIDASETVLRLVFFGDAADNAGYRAQLETINAAVGERFGDRRPVVTCVAQRPLEGDLVMEATVVERGGGVEIGYGEGNYLVMTDAAGRELIVGGVVGDDPADDFKTRSDRVFERIGRIMEREGFPVDSIVRQWNYIEGITRMERGRQHYQDFNDARSRFYSRAGWADGYPAATGIGSRTGGVTVELDALVAGADVVDMPLDNSLQVAAHTYSQGVLVGGVDCGAEQKTTPKFERARLIGRPGDAIVLISGTAAIRGEASSVTDDVTEQTRITMENVEFLSSPGNINSRGGIVTGETRRFDLLRVYIKEPDHLGRVRDYMDSHYGDVPKFYLHADVCRPELLVEVEGVADIMIT
jgi:hypothetical protein